MCEETKRVWDLVLSLVTTAGAVVAFWLSIHQWRKGQAWQRAAKGRELMDNLLKSEDSDEEYYAWDAMKMLDYQDAKMPLMTKLLSQSSTGQAALKEAFPVNRAVIKRALRSTRKDETDPKLLYVRECFDEMYFKLGQLQDAIDNGLVELRHVSCPVDYYVGLMADDVLMHHDYLTRHKYPRALGFLENFPAWREARLKADLPKSP